MKQKRPRTACERAGAFRCLAFQALRMHRESCPPWEIARERRKFLLNSFQKGQWPWRPAPMFRLCFFFCFPDEEAYNSIQVI